MNWQLLILSTVLVSILVFLHFKETLYLALFWFWSSGVTATVMLVYQICSTPWGQFFPHGTPPHRGPGQVLGLHYQVGGDVI